MEHDARSLAGHLVGVAVVVAVPMVLGAALDAVVSGARVGGGAFPPWLPTFGPVGRTVLTYSLAVSAVTYVFVPAAVFALGYRYGRRRPRAT
jgi:hypothetical protein